MKVVEPMDTGSFRENVVGVRIHDVPGTSSVFRVDESVKSSPAKGDLILMDGDSVETSVLVSSEGNSHGFHGVR